MQENKNGCFFLNTVYIIDIFLPTLTASELIYRRLWSKLFTWSNVIHDSQPNYKICMRTKLPITRVIIKSVLQSEQQQQLASCGPHVLHIRKKARSIYRVCICMHPMTLSEVPVWPIFDFRFWGQMTPKVKRKCLSRFRDETPNYIRFVTKFGENRPLQSSRKVLWITTQKNSRSAGRVPALHFAQNGPIAPKIPWTLSPLDMSTYTELGPDRLRFAGLIPERLIFRLQK